MSTNTLYIFSDIHGDFDALVVILTKLIKVATFENSIWKWIAKDTTVVCLGDFVDRYRVKNEYILSTRESINEEIKIITCFKSLQEQATIQLNNSSFIVLIGNHEIISLLQLPEYYQYQIQNPEDVIEQEMRFHFVRDHLLDFVYQCGVIVQWGDIIMCHGGLEYNWLKRHKLDSITKINNRFKICLNSRQKDCFKIFMEDDSILVSRKIALQTNLWRENDKNQIMSMFEPIINPKFIVGHTTVSQILETNLDFISTPQCSKNNTSILSSKNYYGNDDIYFVDVAMSKGFLPMYANLEQINYQRPQALGFRITMDEQGTKLFSQCSTF